LENSDDTLKLSSLTNYQTDNEVS